MHSVQQASAMRAQVNKAACLFSTSFLLLEQSLNVVALHSSKDECQRGGQPLAIHDLCIA